MQLPWGTLNEIDLSQSILFSNDPAIVKRERGRIPLAQDEIEFFDEGKLVPSTVLGSDVLSKPAIIKRPMTAVRGDF